MFVCLSNRYIYIFLDCRYGMQEQACIDIPLMATFFILYFFLNDDFTDSYQKMHLKM